MGDMGAATARSRGERGVRSLYAELRGVVSEQISPELVLVDPELASRARASLNGLWSGAGDYESRAGKRPVGLSRVEATRRRQGIRTVAVVAAMLAAGGLLSVASWTLGRRAQKPAQETARQPRRPLLSSRATAQVPEDPGAKRTFVWLRHEGASYYHLVIQRRGRTIFEAWPRSPKLTFDAGSTKQPRIAFPRGEYVWSVRPGFGQRARHRYGPPIVRSTWVVP